MFVARCAARRGFRRGELIQLLGQQPLDLAFGDRQADRLQQGRQARQCGLTLMILHQHETPQVGAEVSLGPIRQRRDDRLAVCCDPTLAEVADRMDRKHKLLDLIGLVALEACSGRHRSLDDPILDDNTRPDLATAWALSLHARPGRFGGFFHAFRLDGRTALQLLFSRAISSRCSAFIRSNSAILSNSLATSSFSCKGDRPSRSSGGLTHSLNLAPPSRRKKIMQPRPEFCRYYAGRH